MSVRGAAQILIALLLLAGSRSARGEEAHAALVYDPGPAELSCPDARAFRHKIEARLGYDPFVAEDARKVSVVFRSRNDALVAEVMWSGASSSSQARTRTFEGRRGACEELAEAVASATAIAIDPSRLVPPPAPAPPTDAPVAPAPSPAPAPAPPPASPPPPAREPPPAASPEPLVRRVALGLGPSFGAVPAVGFGATLAVDLGGSVVSLRVGAGGVAGLGAEDTRAGAFRMHRVGLFSGPCLRADVLLGCAVLEIGGAFGELPSGSRSALVLRALVRVEVDVVRRGSLRFFPFAEAGLAPVRSRALVGASSVWNESVVSATFGLGVAFAGGS